MDEMNAEKTVTAMALAAGLLSSESRSGDIRVLNKRFYPRVLAGGSLALGESYMDGWWESDDLEETIYRILQSGIYDHIRRQPLLATKIGLYQLRARFLNLSSRRRAFQVGKKHYDIGNDIYRNMLDEKYMAYSCAYWRSAGNLDQAQENKLDLICRKLNLEPGMRLVDIGCGFGGLLKFATANYGVKGRGITVSKEQARLARRLLPADISISVMDYRELKGQYDRVVSVGMFEHVGYKNYPNFMRLANQWLTDGGLLLLHTIGRNSPAYAGDPWMEKYIFSNSMLPAIEQIDQAARPYLVMEDWHNFGPDYVLTLREWWRRFDQSWPLLAGKYGDRFYRMWRYYLLSSAAAFQARRIQLWQVVFSKGLEETYDSVR